MSRLRISAISYLNTAPLMWDFERGNAGRDFDISYTVPSACARALSAGTADIGIIPAAAYTTIPDLVIVPDVAIAARQAVRSILLVSRKPLAEVRTVALDNSSMTSVALTKIILAKWRGGPREYVSAEPVLETMLATSDAALLIGDPALQVDRKQYETLDLAEEWIARTGKPFVFAFWAVRKQALVGHDPQKVAKAFQDSRDHGLAAENLEKICAEWAPRLCLTESIVRTYLTENIYYQLDQPCLEGLKLFYRYGRELGALPDSPELRFLS
jgi:chorismate dehydratase